MRPTKIDVVSAIPTKSHRPIVLYSTMKFTVIALIPATASAFVMTGPSYRYSHQQYQLRATSTGMAASEAIAAAMAASKQFGAASPEARVAWDTVEEINASDNRYGMVFVGVRVRD
jgi:CP12 domain